MQVGCARTRLSLPLGIAARDGALEGLAWFVLELDLLDEGVILKKVVLSKVQDQLVSRLDVVKRLYPQLQGGDSSEHNKRWASTFLDVAAAASFAVARQDDLLTSVILLRIS